MRIPLCLLLLGVIEFTGFAAERREWRVPPRGIAIAETDRLELREEATRLGRAIGQLRSELGPAHLDLLPDVEVFHKAVDWALTYEEFYKSNEVAAARALLKVGLERAAQLKAGEAHWLTATGLVVRGYASKIDGSVQPYGLVVPASFRAGAKQRLDVWLHGRDNFLTELKFINGRMKSRGQFAPPDTIVLHPYGRFCNAFKFAGEVDVLEAMEHVREQYAIDDARVAIRGFSMGGAGCWHLATHYAGTWAGAAPGAGFAETAEYSKILTKDPKPPAFEQRLWHLYDATDYAVNLHQCPTIAYSGEIDKQKQAADIMDRAMAKEGVKLSHIIGPNTGHKYESKAKADLERRFDAVMAEGRSIDPKRVRFTTWTLRYNEMRWVRVEGLVRHWERARVEASLVSDTIGVNTENVSAFSLTVPGSFGLGNRTRVLVDGDRLTVPLMPPSNPASVLFLRSDGRWSVAPQQDPAVDGVERFSGRKRPGLQGPIDDAFMDSFIMVRPTGKPLSASFGEWVTREMSHATNEWRGQFRGYARVKDDSAVTEGDIAENNIVLWGDPRSNRLLARMMDKLPLTWDEKMIQFRGSQFSSAKHVPVMVFPNPLNPKRYVVINSGFTFCESGNKSNSLQTPKLPDYAIIDMTVPISSRYPGGVLLAGFFDEGWE